MQVARLVGEMVKCDLVMACNLQPRGIRFASPGDGISRLSIDVITRQS